MSSFTNRIGDKISCIYDRTRYSINYKKRKKKYLDLLGYHTQNNFKNREIKVHKEKRNIVLQCKCKSLHMNYPRLAILILPLVWK